MAKSGRGQENSFVCPPSLKHILSPINSTHTSLCVHTYMHTCFFFLTTHIHIHANFTTTEWSCSPGRARMPVHLVTKKALGAMCMENGLGTRRRTSYLLRQVPIHSCMDWWGWWEAEKEDWTIFVCEWWDSNP